MGDADVVGIAPSSRREPPAAGDLDRGTVTVVITDDRHQWNVAPVFLSRVLERLERLQVWRLASDQAQGPGLNR